MKTCVIIPTYNESKTIAGLIRQIRNLGLDTVVIDDGSTDTTPDQASESGAVVLKNRINLGKGASLVSGFHYVLSKDYDAVIIMDGDGQHLPEDIPSFLAQAAFPEKNIIIGNRMNQTKNMPLVRILTNKFMSWLISLIAKQKIPDTQCGFRLVKRQILEKLNLKTSKYEIESEMLIKSSRLGFKIDSVAIKTIYKGEKSQINPISDTLRFFKYIIRELWITRN